ncbi:MAG: PQQ-dependent sugar dehydrogenase [Candidatus Eisenbacteria bacterium]
MTLAAGAIAAAFALLLGTSAHNPGLEQRVLTDSLDSPVSMAVAPDGRVLVCEQGGHVRMVRAGRLLARPCFQAPTVADHEEGLLAVAFDPDFARDHWVYLLYTVAQPVRHERLTRVTISGDTALANSEQVLFELDAHTDRTHVGGALHFGEDGMLYVSTGENGAGEQSQDLRSTHGKILRLRRDGSIPEDNPFFDMLVGRHRAVYARGMRNAFSFDIQPGTGRIFVNDVGADSVEEVNDVVAGGNYGWPIEEGSHGTGAYLPPIHTYTHREGCAITGGAFYAARRPRLPRRWLGDYFYADYCASEIRAINPGAPMARRLVLRTVRAGPVDLRVAADGALLYLARGNTDVTGGPHSSRGSLVRVSTLERSRDPRH